MPEAMMKISHSASSLFVYLIHNKLLKPAIVFPERNNSIPFHTRNFTTCFLEMTPGATLNRNAENDIMK